MQLPNTATLKEAKELLRAEWEKGLDCPCCGRLVKLYAYKLNSGSARSLIILYRADNEEPNSWVHIQRYFAKMKLNANSMNYILLKHWGLVEAKPNPDDPSKKASGYWKITEKGKQFVEKAITVPSHAYVYDNKTFRYSEEQTTIIEALGKKFNYAELMGF